MDPSCQWHLYNPMRIPISSSPHASITFCLATKIIPEWMRRLASPKIHRLTPITNTINYDLVLRFCMYNDVHSANIDLVDLADWWMGRTYIVTSRLNCHRTMHGSMQRYVCYDAQLLCYKIKKYRNILNIRRTESPNSNVSRLALQLSSSNPIKPGVKSRMKIKLEQRRQA